MRRYAERDDEDMWGDNIAKTCLYVRIDFRRRVESKLFCAAARGFMSFCLRSMGKSEPLGVECEQDYKDQCSIL